MEDAVFTAKYFKVLSEEVLKILKYVESQNRLRDHILRYFDFTSIQNIYMAPFQKDQSTNEKTTTNFATL